MRCARPAGRRGSRRRWSPLTWYSLRMSRRRARLRETTTSSAWWCPRGRASALLKICSAAPSSLTGAWSTRRSCSNPTACRPIISPTWWTIIWWRSPTWSAARSGLIRRPSISCCMSILAGRCRRSVICHCFAIRINRSWASAKTRPVFSITSAWGFCPRRWWTISVAWAGRCLMRPRSSRSRRCRPPSTSAACLSVARYLMLKSLNGWTACGSGSRSRWTTWRADYATGLWTARCWTGFFPTPRVVSRCCLISSLRRRIWYPGISLSTPPALVARARSGSKPWCSCSSCCGVLSGSRTGAGMRYSLRWRRLPMPWGWNPRRCLRRSSLHCRGTRSPTRFRIPWRYWGPTWPGRDSGGR